MVPVRSASARPRRRGTRREVVGEARVVADESPDQPFGPERRVVPGGGAGEHLPEGVGDMDAAWGLAARLRPEGLQGGRVHLGAPLADLGGAEPFAAQQGGLAGPVERVVFGPDAALD